ncbi:hypothetical protein CTI12_AA364630 [Artemisia annua]|uniref:VAN3-binding protein-like auxin canalisation domain-containing protein n=1 Tax=Artemisia annua TaxID=35608 RepID=A0A2U1MM49_ARTAN|nr:hypothetical protein CTI12_AA364630 [Artemisia annua]
MTQMMLIVAIFLASWRTDNEMDLDEVKKMSTVYGVAKALATKALEILIKLNAKEVTEHAVSKRQTMAVAIATATAA